MFHGFLSESIPAIAIEKGLLTVRLIDFRDFSGNRHHQVDDYQYGGGAGMVIKPEPLAGAIEHIKATSQAPDSPIVYFTPQGHLLTQKRVRQYLEHTEVTLLCGHYKEIDQRIRDIYVTDEVSIGDYILSGGELPAMVLTDAIARLLDGAISDAQSASTDSHENGLLGFPCYTRPFEFQGRCVPEVLCSGHHLKIEQWRREKSLELTEKVRPDLLLKRETQT
jgi:tRNA (guanine37-N1)-methyltransferase